MSEDFVEDTRAIMERHLDGIRNRHKTNRSFCIGFISFINELHFPLLSNEELTSFRKEFEELTNRLFPKQ